jgi:adenylate kinase
LELLASPACGGLVKDGLGTDRLVILKHKLEQREFDEEFRRCMRAIHADISSGPRQRHWSQGAQLLLDNLRRAPRPTGIIICFSGPDGSGKTTANDALTTFLQRELQVPIVNYKHLYPLNRAMAASGLKVQARLRGIDPKDAAGVERDRGEGLAWYSRRVFGLMSIVAQFGLGYVEARLHNFAGKTVIVDTSIFDAFVKGHRPQVKLLERLLSPVLPVGDVWFLLTADPTKIVARKPELTEDEIHEYYERMGQLTARAKSRPERIQSDRGVAVAHSAMLTRVLEVIDRKLRF